MVATANETNALRSGMRSSFPGVFSRTSWHCQITPGFDSLLSKGPGNAQRFLLWLVWFPWQLLTRPPFPMGWEGWVWPLHPRGSHVPSSHSPTGRGKRVQR